jgi:uncharacterized protein YndB with AHSA1/START domain
MTARSNVAVMSADQEVVFTRMFDARRALVFEAWTGPKHVVQWSGPTYFTTTNQLLDVWACGVWKLVLHGADATDYPNKSVITEV